MDSLPVVVTQVDGIDGKVCHECGEWRPLKSFKEQPARKGKGRARRIGICRRCKYKRPHVKASHARRRHNRYYRDIEATRLAEQITTSHKRAIKCKAPGTFTADEWLALCAKYGRCLKCGSTMRRLTIDHIIPLKAPGATHDLSGIQPLCRNCNASKSRRIIDYRPDLSCLLP